MAKFAYGMVIGAAAGMAAGMMCAGSKRGGRKLLSKMLKTAGDIVDDFSSAMGW